LTKADRIALELQELDALMNEVEQGRAAEASVATAVYPANQTYYQRAYKYGEETSYSTAEWLEEKTALKEKTGVAAWKVAVGAKVATGAVVKGAILAAILL